MQKKEKSIIFLFFQSKNTVSIFSQKRATLLRKKRNRVKKKHTSLISVKRLTSSLSLDLTSLRCWTFDPNKNSEILAITILVWRKRPSLDLTATIMMKEKRFKQTKIQQKFPFKVIFERASLHSSQALYPLHSQHGLSLTKCIDWSGNGENQGVDEDIPSLSKSIEPDQEAEEEGIEGVYDRKNDE